MKYILYFDSWDNDTYFYDTLEELLKNWDCKTLEEFKYKENHRTYIIFKTEKVILEGGKCDKKRTKRFRSI